MKSWSPILVQPSNGRFCVLPSSLFFLSQLLALQGGYIEMHEGPAKKAAFWAGCTTYADLTLLICLLDAYCPRLYASASRATARDQFNAARLAAPSFLAQTTQQLPPSLLAPCYLHLMEEAKSLSKQDSLGCDILQPVIRAIHSTAFGLVLNLLCAVDAQWAASDAALTSRRWMSDWQPIRECWYVCQN